MNQYRRTIERRAFLRYPLAASTLAFLPNAAIVEQLLGGMSFLTPGLSPTAEDSPSKQGWFMPSEQAAHKRCWMAWPARMDVWQRQLDEVRQDIARLAQAIAGFEPVTMLVEPDQVPLAEKLCGSAVSLQPMSVDDTWFRDSGPIFLVNEKHGLAGSTFNFNGWGKKQVHERDAKIAGEVLAHLGVPAFRAPFVAEGGAVENDGEGTLLVVQSSIFNKNRNPGKSREDLTEGLKGWLGVDKVLWLPDSHPDYWTDGHVDGVARFVKPGVVLVDQGLPETVEFLRQAQDAKGRKLQVIEFPRPEKVHPGATFCNCYLNFYFANGAVIIPQFGDKNADDRAHGIVAEGFPQRKVYPIQLDTLASGGGLIHCVTQQEPAV